MPAAVLHKCDITVEFKLVIVADMVRVALIFDLSGSMREEYELTMRLAREIVYGLDMQVTVNC